MKLRPKSLDFENDVLFSADKLGRKSLAQGLTKLILQAQTPYVISLTAPYGMGKTTFLKFWMRNLRESTVRFIYFNAWESDHSDDPIVPLIGEIHDFVAKIRDVRIDGNARRIMESTTKLAAHFAKKIIPAVVRLSTAGVVDSEKIGELLSTAAEDVSREAIENYTADREKMTQFRQALESAVGLTKTGDVSGPLVFIVDELDRCRPNYALEVLERIKHLYTIDDVVFVLGMDKDQMQSMVKAVYGGEIKAQEYLRRFVDLELKLPNYSISEFVSVQLKHIDLEGIVANRRRPGFMGISEVQDVSDIIELMHRDAPASLRSIEQMICRLGVVLKTAENIQMFFSEVVIFLIYFGEVAPDEYKLLMEGKINRKALVKMITEDLDFQHLIRTKVGVKVVSFITAIVLDRETRDEFDFLARQLGKNDPELCSAAQDVLYSMGQAGTSNRVGLREFGERIQLASNFKA